MKDTISWCVNSSSAHAEPIFANVSGAPFRIGDVVRVIQIVDATGNQKLRNKTGIVQYLEYSCGCGQTYPGDPMIGVLVGSKAHEFWKEELSLIACSTKNNP
jgi:hypothetical protein